MYGISHALRRFPRRRPRPDVRCRRTPYSRRCAAQGVLFIVLGICFGSTEALARQPTDKARLCVAYAAAAYEISESALLAILEVEGGRAGQAVQNTNGTSDLGPMQINTLWLPMLKKRFGLTKPMIRDNVCINVFVGGWILAQHIHETGSTVIGIARYHSRTPKYQVRYLKRIGNVLARRTAAQQQTASITNGSM